MSAANDAAGVQRLFVGIELNDTVRAACAAISKRLQATGLTAIYEDPSKFHITLAFLGNVPACRFDEIARAMRDAASICERFELTLDKLAAFPHERKPHVIYIGAREQGPAFRALTYCTQQTYRTAGFRFEDDPVAHITIARTKQPHRPLPVIELAPVGLIVNYVSLFASRFDKEKSTSRYEVLSSVTLPTSLSGA